MGHQFLKRIVIERAMMKIRYLEPSDDRKAISRIYELSWKYAYAGIIPQDYLDQIPEGRWADKIVTPGWNTLVCIENGEYIGTSSFCRSRFEQYSESGEVISIYFLPEYMGKGYGYRLLSKVVNELKNQGFEEVFLWVLEDNHRARKFYEKFGFLCTGDYIEDSIGGKELREVRYIYRFNNEKE